MGVVEKEVWVVSSAERSSKIRIENELLIQYDGSHWCVINTISMSDEGET